ncbi:hypothetical protein B0T16DRAFT_213255 [Cercophora newfieldiana]|uniref:Uncharacterized protein n=1 Tax=Cercophora newfieldiana TaxID=92897 RepID=A0AA39XXP4_9PEZI|nr:hypothetical protein B0T16DRAFT_213255 [Cercophora newfieldiana]
MARWFFLLRAAAQHRLFITAFANLADTIHSLLHYQHEQQSLGGSRLHSMRAIVRSQFTQQRAVSDEVRQKLYENLQANTTSDGCRELRALGFGFESSWLALVDGASKGKDAVKLGVASGVARWKAFCHLMSHTKPHITVCHYRSTWSPRGSE